MTKQKIEINVPSITLIIAIIDGTEMGRVFIIRRQVGVPDVNESLMISDDERREFYQVQVTHRLWEYSIGADSTTVHLRCKKVEKQ